MVKRNVIVAGLLLLVSLVLGAGLLFGGEHIAGGWIYLGFLLFVGSIVAIIVLAIRQLPKGMDVETVRRWEIIRIKGKWSYVRSFVFWYSAPFVFLSAILFFFPGELQISYAEYVRNMVALAVIAVGCAYFFAVGRWNDNEKQYLEYCANASEKDQLGNDVGIIP